MIKKRTVATVCALILVTAFTGVGCVARHGSTQEQEAASPSELSTEQMPSSASTSAMEPDRTATPQPTQEVSDVLGEQEAASPELSTDNYQLSTDKSPKPTAASTPKPATTSTPKPTPEPAPIPASTPQQSRTICNTCGADITGNVPAHGDGHLLAGEDFSYRVE